jgi:SAM-dependent methyltransferase
MKNSEENIRNCYSTWGETYYNDYYSDNSAYPPVHLDLILKKLTGQKGGNLLDIGCGPASMLRHFKDLEFQLFGFDLTPEMVAECKKVMSGLDPSNFWVGSVLNKSDFFRSPNSPEKYDASTCIGVLPHIPEEFDSMVIRNIKDSLNPGGLAIIEARNELFALFTMNRYSGDFFESKLLPKSHIKAELGDEKFTEICSKINKQFRMDLPKIRKGKANEPGYDEILSRTHNPFELKEYFVKAGFREVKTLFYHFHAAPPMLKETLGEKYNKISMALEKNPEDWRGYFMASAFLTIGIAA